MSKATNIIDSCVDKGIYEVGAVSKAEMIKNAMMTDSMTIIEQETIKTLRHATVRSEEAFNLYDAAFCKMLKRQVEVEEATRKHVSLIKDKANQVAEALARIEKLAGVDFDAKLQRLERFAAAVDVLDRLNKTGKLAECAKALSGLSGS